MLEIKTTNEDKQIFENLPVEQKEDSAAKSTENEKTITAAELVTETDSPIDNFTTEILPQPEPLKRGRGRHPKGCTCGNCKQSQGSPSVIGAAPSNVVPMIAAVGPDYLGLSGMIFDTSTNALAVGFGDEWKPRTSDERDNVCKALAIYLKSKEVKDIPPGMMLTIVICAYAGPRFSQPSTKEKIRSGWTWLKSKFKRKEK